MKEFKAVIFDMDGVIIDSEPLHHEVNKKIFNKLGINVSDEEYQSFIGTSNTYMWTILKEKHGLTESIDELNQLQLTENIDYLNNHQENPIPGILALLNLFKEYGLKIALASSSPIEYIKKVLENLGLEAYFDITISGESFERGKPYPDIFLHTAKVLGVNPEECVVIEDSQNGVKAARNAGMKIVGYQNVNSGNQDLSEADMVVNSLEKIGIEVFKELINK